MTSSARIKFEISFEGSSQCWKDANVCAIDLVGPKSEVSAQSVGKGDSSLRAGRLTWHITSKDIQGEKLADQITLASGVAKTIQLTARVFESYDNLSRLVLGLDGIMRPERWAKRHDLPIVIEDHAELEGGECYLIKVKNVGERFLRAELIKLDERAPKMPKPKESKAAETISQDLVKPLMDLVDKLGLRSAPGFSGWNNMVETFKQAHQADDDALDSLATAELQKCFNEGVSQVKEARRRFNEACIYRVGMNEALAHKQSVSSTLIKLEAALNLKGVFPSYSDTL